MSVSDLPKSAPSEAAAGVEQIDVRAVNRKTERLQYASRQKIYPKLTSGFFRNVKWLVMLVCMGIYYVAPWIRWDRGAGLPDQAILIDMANGRLDAANDDIVVLQQWLDSPDGACCKLIGAIKPDVKIHGPGAGIAVRKGETDLVHQFNAAIDAIRANGKYKEINDKYFKFDVYGGDS